MDSAVLESFLENNFTPLELWGLISRAYGVDLCVEHPGFLTQNDLFGEVACGAVKQPVNRFFFEELLRCRPWLTGEIDSFAEELGLVIRKRRARSEKIEKDHPNPTASYRNGRFLRFETLKQGYLGDECDGWDNALGIPLRIYLTPLGEAPEREACFRDLLNLTQLPHQNLMKVMDAFEVDGRMVIVSDGSDQVVEALESLEAFDAVIGQILSALDAAHQRDMVHGPIRNGDICWDTEWNVSVGGFGVNHLSNEMGEINDDFVHLGEWLKNVFGGHSERVDKFIGTIVDESASFYHTSDLLDLLEEDDFDDIAVTEEVELSKPVMRVDCDDEIRLRSWFGDAIKVIRLRNIGEGPMAVRVTSDKDWLDVIQEWPDPNLLIQEIEIVFRKENLFETSGESTLVFLGPDGQTRKIKVISVKSFWLWPLIAVIISILLISNWVG